MNSTFNVKIILFLTVTVLVTIVVSAIYINDMVDLEDKDFLFIPVIISLVFTLLRCYNNIVEKSKLVEKLLEEKENSSDAKKISFDTCPDYWTKTSSGDVIYCKNEFVDADGDKNYIGGTLKKLDEVDGVISNELESSDSAKHIGFALHHSQNEDGEQTFANAEHTYIPSMRASMSNQDAVETFENDVGHDTIPHKHTRTYVDYAHTNTPVTWKDGKERDHDTLMYRDGDHMAIYTEDVYHDHTGNNNLYDYQGNLIWGRQTPENMSASAVSADEQNNNLYKNDENWIGPFNSQDGALHAQINLNELNKIDNKCQLVKNLPWTEAKNKCANVNVKFDS